MEEKRTTYVGISLSWECEDCGTENESNYSSFAQIEKDQCCGGCGIDVTLKL